MRYLSYESLPPNFSLLQNMAAGAFAGIAVCLISRAKVDVGSFGEVEC
jgi:hypothetical protein